MVKKILLIATLILVIHYAHGEEEIDGDAKFLNFSSRGLKDTLDLSSFAQLTAVDFSNNDMTTISWHHFAAPHLREVNLAGNALLTLPEFGPRENIPLKVLNISNCNVKIIPDNALRSLDLEIMDIHGNPVQFKETNAFDGLETPPKLLIVSKITQSELHHICKNVDMQILILDASKTKECKDIRRTDEKIEQSPTREQLSKPKSKNIIINPLQDVIVEDELLTDNTHMEMLGDEPLLEGSGMESEIIVPAQDILNPIKLNDTDDEEHKEGDTKTEENESDDTAHEEKDDDENEDKENGKIDDTLEKDTIQTTEGNEKDIFNDSTSTEGKQNSNEETTNDKTEETNASIEEEKGAILNGKGAPEKVKIAENNNVIEDETKKTMAKNPLERAGVSSTHLVADNNEKEVQQIARAIDDAVIGENKSEISSASNRNVILVVIVGLFVVVSAFIAVKLYKDHKNYNSVLNDDPSEGKEMQVIQPSENKPLMNEKSSGSVENLTNEQLAEVVIVPKPNKTTKEILEDGENSGLPDIDDPNRLSTFLVSNPKLNSV